MSKSKRRPTAPEYVSKMDLPRNQRQMLTEVAESFQNKSFLPTAGDIRNFCELYGIQGPAPRARAGAVPRLFRFLATMDPDEVRGLLRGGMFSGPARLGPIADAIRAAGREQIRERTLRDQDDSSRRAAE